MRKLNLSSTKRQTVYSDAKIAQALLFLEQSELSIAAAAEKLNIKRGTLSAWKTRYVKDDEFAERIDGYIEKE